MNFVNKMEKKFGRYAIHNLMLYLIILYVVGFFIINTNPAFYVRYLSLDAASDPARADLEQSSPM